MPNRQDPESGNDASGSLSCPIPEDLSDILKNHPESLARLQDELNRYASGNVGREGQSFRSSYGMARDALRSILSDLYSEVARAVIGARSSSTTSESEAINEKARVFSALPFYIDFGDFSCIADYLTETRSRQ